MNIEHRNDFGFPVVERRVLQAKLYAADVQSRRSGLCLCEGCQIKAMEPFVMNIVGKNREEVGN